MINKELFIKIMNDIELQHTHDAKCAEAFSVILPNDYTSLYDNSKLYSSIITLLCDIFKDENKTEMSWIEYFIYELEFGKKYKDGCTKMKNENVDISDSSKLYDFLIVNMK